MNIFSQIFARYILLLKKTCKLTNVYHKQTVLNLKQSNISMNHLGGMPIFSDQIT